MHGMKDNYTFSKNMSAFSKAYPDEAAKYDKVVNNKEKFELETVRSYSGEEAVRAILPDGRKYMLEGIYGKDDYINDIIESYGRIAPKTPLFLVGTMYIDLVRKFAKATKDECLVVLYEPSLKIFDYVMHTMDITDLFGELPATLYIEGLTAGKLSTRMASIFTLEIFPTLKIFIAPNYENICREKVHLASKGLRDAFTELMSAWHTGARYTDVANKNLIYNLTTFADGYNVSQLKGILGGEYPAFVVSAGPSLNKNINELKKIKGRAAIVAVDTAIKPLLNHGIKPDFFCIVDGKKPTELMNHPGIHEIPLVTHLSVASGIMDLHKGKKFFYGSSESIEEEVLRACRKESGHKKYLTSHHLPTGGSVANTAFSFAYYMGAKEVILVGQDLALTNGRTHADGTFKAKMDKLNLTEDPEYFEVEGIRGNKVYTRGDFDMYRVWFEKYIKDNNLTNAIDATQGGAKIHGTKIMTLKRAIETYCVKKVNLKEKIDALPKMLDYGAKKGLSEFYYSLPEKLMEVNRKAKQGERAYRKFAKLTKAEEVDNKEVIKCADKIKEINDYMNSDQYALFVQAGMIDIDYVMRMSIYEEQEDETEERMQIAKQGILLNGLIALYAKAMSDNIAAIVKKRTIKPAKKDINGKVDKFLYELAKEAR